AAIRGDSVHASDKAARDPVFHQLNGPAPAPVLRKAGVDAHQGHSVRPYAAIQVTAGAPERVAYQVRQAVAREPHECAPAADGYSLTTRRDEAVVRDQRRQRGRRVWRGWTF